MNKDLITKLNPNTELGIDLKLLTCKPGRLPVEAMLDGMLIHDDENHYTFTENVLEKKAADVNRDGEITIRDATLIQMYLANIITEF